MPLNRLPSILLAALVVIGVAIAWWWLGRAQALPDVPLPPNGRIACVSYAPFEEGQSPFDAGLVIPPEQIDRQLAALAKISRCVRTYSTQQGLNKVPEIAARHGLTVLLGIWLGSEDEGNEIEIADGIALATAHPETIRGVIVGNEVMLRGEMTQTELAGTIARVREAVAQPVTYADVWEYWVRYPELAEVVDFVTIHILPFWENRPVEVDQAAAHVLAVRRLMAERMAGKEILIGETGWPSAGRMRRGALPSPVNQARFFHEVLAAAEREGWDYNLIEAIDQRWKRQLEGTVGGHWGLLTPRLKAKFRWGETLSDHPFWRWQAAGGALLALAVVVCGAAARGRALAGVVALALVAGIAFPWWAAELPVVSLTKGDWIRGGLAIFLSLLLPCLAARALALDRARASLASLFGRAPAPAGWLPRLLGWGLVLTLFVAFPALLGLTFDSRYRDFINAAMAPSIVALLLVPARPAPGLVERVFALLIIPAALFVLGNERPENHQALLFVLLQLLLAAALLVRPRGGRATAAPA